MCSLSGRDGGTQTHSLLVPNQAVYQIGIHLGVGRRAGTRTPSRGVGDHWFTINRLSYKLPNAPPILINLAV